MTRIERAFEHWLRNTHKLALQTVSERDIEVMRIAWEAAWLAKAADDEDTEIDQCES